MNLPNVLRACVALVALVSCHAARASDHREAPTIYEDPTADIADLYAFTSPNNPGNLVLVLTVQPFATTANPQSYAFSKDVLYTFNIDTDEDAVADEKIDIRFSAPAFGNQKMWVKFPRQAPLQGEATWVLSALHSAPPPVVNKGPSNIQYFAGLRDDPFFFDSLAGFRFFAFGEKFSTGIDRLAGKNVLGIVIEVPYSVVSRRPHQKLGIWATTHRKQHGDWKQIQRAGNPAVKAVLMPIELKDQYNFTEPKHDVALYGQAIRNAVKGPLGQTDAVADLLISQVAPDLLRIDPARPIAWPNGRRLDEDVFDEMFAWNLNKPTAFAPGELDGVRKNDVPFLNEFPYLAPPHIAP
jgi:Domain of unknown function (DUF4331)